MTAKDALKTAVIVEPPTSAPFVELDLKPTVQVVTAAAAWVFPANEIVAAGVVAATIEGEGDAFAEPSADVLTLIVLAPVVVVFVMPTISNVAAVFLARAQVWPLGSGATMW